MDENRKKGLVNARRQSKCPVFVDPCDIKDHQLPSYNAVMICNQLIRNELKCIKGKIFLCLSLR